MKELTDLFDGNGYSIIDDTESHDLEQQDLITQSVIESVAMKCSPETSGMDPEKGYKSEVLHLNDKYSYPIAYYYDDITIDGVVHKDVLIDIYHSAEHKYNRMPVKYRVHGGFNIQEIV